MSRIRSWNHFIFEFIWCFSCQLAKRFWKRVTNGATTQHYHEPSSSSSHLHGYLTILSLHWNWKLCTKIDAWVCRLWRRWRACRKQSADRIDGSIRSRFLMVMSTKVANRFRDFIFITQLHACLGAQIICSNGWAFIDWWLVEVADQGDCKSICRILLQQIASLFFRENASFTHTLQHNCNKIKSGDPQIG